MERSHRSFWKVYRFPLILLGSIVLGCVLGLKMGKDALVLKPLGDIFLNAMFTVVVPLVFTTVTSAVSNMSSMKRLKSVMGSLVLVFVVTGVIAALLMLVSVHFFPPAAGTQVALTPPENLQPLSTADQIVNLNCILPVLSKRFAKDCNK